MREPAIPCPHCEAQTTAADLVRHVATTCPGRREPHALSKWVTWCEALELGVPRETMHRWVRQGRVHTRGIPRRRRYLLRDVTKLLVMRRKVGPINRTNR